MPPLSEELRTIADTAIRALNSGDLDSFLSVVSGDAEFTSGSFQNVRWEILDVEGSGGRGLARLRAFGDLGGVEVEQMVWQAARYHDGKLDWWGFFRAESDAREAAGVAPGQA